MTLVRLVQRNILVYTRDRSNVFFSLLSMLIIIGLMAIFLGNLNVESIVDLLSETGVRNVAADRENAENLVLLWTLAGIIVVNALTITLAMAGIMVEDEEKKRLHSFFVAPVRRSVLVLGYIIAAFIMGIIMCLLTLILGEGFVLLTGGTLLSLASLTEVLFFIILIVFMASSLVFLITNFVHTTSAFAGLSTIIGTLAGFLAAIYLPIGALPATIQNSLKVFPLLHGCSLVREAFTKEMLQVTFAGCPDEMINGYKEYMGINIKWGETLIGDSGKIAFLIVSGIVFILIAAFIQKRRNTVSR